MEVEFDGSDYYIHIAPEEGRKISIPISSRGGFKYDWLDGKVKSNLSSH